MLSSLFDLLHLFQTNGSLGLIFVVLALILAPSFRASEGLASLVDLFLLFLGYMEPQVPDHDLLVLREKICPSAIFRSGEIL